MADWEQERQSRDADKRRQTSRGRGGNVEAAVKRWQNGRGRSGRVETETRRGRLAEEEAAD
jgi:hypothetical protein